MRISTVSAMLGSTQFAHVGMAMKLPWYLRTGSTLHVLDPWRADDALRLAADRVMAALDEVPLQARVDLVRLDDGSLALISEFGKLLIEPLREIGALVIAARRERSLRLVFRGFLFGSHVDHVNSPLCWSLCHYSS